MLILGYPVLGDGNYSPQQNQYLFRAKGGGKLRHQQLYSTRIKIGDVMPGNCHTDISGKVFKIEPAFELDFESLGIEK